MCSLSHFLPVLFPKPPFPSFMSSAQRRQVQKMIADCFNSSSDKEFLDQALDSVQLILKYREYVSVIKPWSLS